MALRVIGAGVGRTGTKSLLMALNQLGFGPCYHMHELAQNLEANVPLWLAAVDGRPDWETIFKGYASAVDWPTASFYQELSEVYPDARIILTVRSAEGWAESFSETIYKFQAGADQAPAHFQPWFEMADRVLSKIGFSLGLDTAALQKAFNAHTEAVKAAIPADRLLVYEVKDGWAPLCKFLGVAEPAAPFPRTNSRAEFWEVITSGMAGSS